MKRCAGDHYHGLSVWTAECDYRDRWRAVYPERYLPADAEADAGLSEKLYY